MSDILSYGGGTQTAAMCILVARGILPRPDAVIAADTGREMPTTWEYADRYMRPLLASVGLPLHIAGHELATVDIYGHNGDLLIPTYTATGKLPTFCSSEWKARVVERYDRRVLSLQGPRMNWIGFSLDEKKRVKGQDGRRYPLLDLNLTREDCLRIIADEGLPPPPKSRCWMCPHQHNAEWREVRERPELWQQAIELDHEIREADERGGVYLHAQRVPLEQADLEADDRKEPSRQCGLGLCFV
jgi:3'-phosphoadenosine 5'-phosphosulfate sulfotransferase (PAPS reductase)/FAD synthetase